MQGLNNLKQFKSVESLKKNQFNGAKQEHFETNSGYRSSIQWESTPVVTSVMPGELSEDLKADLKINTLDFSSIPVIDMAEFMKIRKNHPDWTTGKLLEIMDDQLSADEPRIGKPFTPISSSKCLAQSELASLSLLLSELKTAAYEIGFCTLINHSVRGSAIEDIFACAEKFFEQSTAEKERFKLDGHSAMVGYFGAGTENLENVKDLKQVNSTDTENIQSYTVRKSKKN